MLLNINNRIDNDKGKSYDCIHYFFILFFYIEDSV